MIPVAREQRREHRGNRDARAGSGEDGAKSEERRMRVVAFVVRDLIFLGSGVRVGGEEGAGSCEVCAEVCEGALGYRGPPGKDVDAE